MSNDEVVRPITSFIRERFLDGDPGRELQETTPLLEWGVMNSLNITQLLGFIREEFGVLIPPLEINARNFSDVRAISSLVAGLAARS